MHTILKANLPDGRYIEHSRTLLPTDQINRRDPHSNLSGVYGYWLESCLASPYDVPVIRKFAPESAVPNIAEHMAVIDVSSEDLSRFKAIRVGESALGLRGFTRNNLNRLSPNGVHWTLLLDMVWMKKDLRPVYLDTELAVDGLPLRYTSLVIPLASSDGRVTNIQVFTKPLLLPDTIWEEAF